MKAEQLHGQCPPIHNNPRVGIGSETRHGYRTLVGIAQINLPRIWVSKLAMPTLHNATDYYKVHIFFYRFPIIDFIFR
ncbi:hypothetical protein [Moorena sp. SIO3H5]|uniref:hypothetical protein n=1 Tax=Moorena sp. SIO3H5 TaxID=2607834 RepID=UPI0013BAB7FB|nr:hypothetical protein [Moorena sp. SIO3H5]NEO72120.1 hypothetical protein [Moorena sp. SIO3H5]